MLLFLLSEIVIWWYCNTMVQVVWYLEDDMNWKARKHMAQTVVPTAIPSSIHFILAYVFYHKSMRTRPKFV